MERIGGWERVIGWAQAQQARDITNLCTAGQQVPPEPERHHYQHQHAEHQQPDPQVDATLAA